MLEDLLLGKGDVDGLTVALSALFLHHYGHRLDDLLHFATTTRPRYFTLLFLAALATHKSVQEYVLTTMDASSSSAHSRRRLCAFVAAVRGTFEAVILNVVPLDAVQQNAYATWMIS